MEKKEEGKGIEKMLESLLGEYEKSLNDNKKLLEENKRLLAIAEKYMGLCSEYRELAESQQKDIERLLQNGKRSETLFEAYYEAFGQILS